MITRIAILALCLPLGACSSVRGLLSFEDAPPPPAVTAAAPVPAAPSGDTWCQQVAASDRQRAQLQGYDAATLDRMTLVSFQQCRSLPAQ